MRCPACGADALTEDARFCVGCGAPFPDPQPGRSDADAGAPQPNRAEPEAVKAAPSRRPVRRAVATPATPVQQAPTVPVPVVIGGVVVLLVILLVLLVSS